VSLLTITGTLVATLVFGYFSRPTAALVFPGASFLVAAVMTFAALACAGSALLDNAWPQPTRQEG